MARENHVGSVGGSNDDQVSVNLIGVLNTLGAPRLGTHDGGAVEGQRQRGGSTTLDQERISTGRGVSRARCHRPP